MVKSDRNLSTAKSCPSCGSSRLDSFYEMSNVPVHCNRLWSDRDEAINCPKGNIKLAFCRQCGFITNTDFDGSLVDYTPEYDNCLHYSPHFQDYARSLAERLIRRYNLRKKDIIDIGCGKGDLLLLLCKMGENRGIGFDTSYVERDDRRKDAVEVTFIKDYYSERYSGYSADLICCLQVLEHLPEPREFLNTIHVAARKRLNSSLFFEVPNATYTLRKLFIWDIIYEHCSYFTAYSLSGLFSSCGFDVTEVAEEFGGQYLDIHAACGNARGTFRSCPSQYIDQVAAEIVSFKTKCHGLISKWKEGVERLADCGKRTVIWGAGSKGVSFLNILGLRDHIAYAVDVNPKKKGMYIAGTGQRIVSPETLKEYKPEVVIVTNPIYNDEIKEMVAGLGITPEFMHT